VQAGAATVVGGDRSLIERSPRGRLADQLLKWGLSGLAAAILALIVYFFIRLIGQSNPSLSHNGLSFVFGNDWDVSRNIYHGAALLVGKSRYTAARVRQLYRREADAVVYPGVDLALFRPGQAGSAYAITGSRLSPEKGLDRLLVLGRDLPDLPLHVVGDGHPDVLRELRQLAPSGVVFRGNLTSGDLAQAYSDDQKARTLLGLTKQIFDRQFALEKGGGAAVKDREQAQSEPKGAVNRQHDSGFSR